MYKKRKWIKGNIYKTTIYMKSIIDNKNQKCYSDYIKRKFTKIREAVKVKIIELQGWNNFYNYCSGNVI